MVGYLFVAFMIGFIIGSAPSNSLNELLWRWQTLIAALFAIGAAVMAVRQMRTDAEKRDEQHRETIRIITTRDRMTVLDARHGLVPNLRWAVRVIGNFLGLTRELPADLTSQQAKGVIEMSRFVLRRLPGMLDDTDLGKHLPPQARAEMHAVRSVAGKFVQDDISKCPYRRRWP